MPLKLKVVNKTGLVFEGEVDFCEILTESGIEGIMPKHINFIAEMVPGKIKYKISGKINEIEVSGNGFAEVSSDNINILLDF